MLMSGVVIAVSFAVIVIGFVWLNVALGPNSRWFPKIRRLKGSWFGGLPGVPMTSLDRLLQVGGVIGAAALAYGLWRYRHGADLTELAMISTLTAAGCCCGYLFQYRRDRLR